MPEYLRPVPNIAEAADPAVVERPLACQLRGVMDDYSLQGFYDLRDIQDDERVQELCGPEQRAALGPVLSRYRGQIKERLVENGYPDTRWIFPDQAFRRAHPETREMQCCLVLGLNQPLTDMPQPTAEIARGLQASIDNLPRTPRPPLVSIYHRPATAADETIQPAQEILKKPRRERAAKPQPVEMLLDDEPIIEPARLGRLAGAMLDTIIAAENPTQGVKPRNLAEAIAEDDVDATLVKKVAGQLPSYFRRLRIKENLRLTYTDYEVRRARQRDRAILEECMGGGLSFDEYREYTGYDALADTLFDNPYQ